MNTTKEHKTVVFMDMSTGEIFAVHMYIENLMDAAARLGSNVTIIGMID